MRRRAIPKPQGPRVKGAHVFPKYYLCLEDKFGQDLTLALLRAVFYGSPILLNLGRSASGSTVFSMGAGTWCKQTFLHGDQALQSDDFYGGAIDQRAAVALLALWSDTLVARFKRTLDEGGLLAPPELDFLQQWTAMRAEASDPETLQALMIRKREVFGVAVLRLVGLWLADKR
jgi:hypothetical protein